MLGKLLKYDWKYSWRLLGLLNGALLVFSLLGQLGSPVLWHGSRMLSGILTVLYAFIYVLLFSGSLIATQIILVVRYYRNFYMDEGYLLHTLPVTTSEKIWAKFINHLIWTFINILCLMFSVLCLLGPAQWENFFSLFSQFFSSISLGLNVPVPVVVLAALAAMLLSLAFMIYSLYFCVSIGSLFPSHRVLASIITYVLLYCVIQLGAFIYLIGTVTTIDRRMHGIQPASVAVTVGLVYTGAMLLLLAGNAVFYGFSYFIAHKKLNLD